MKQAQNLALKANECIVCSTPQHSRFESRDFEYFGCPKCRHVTTYPYPSPEMITEHYRQKYQDGNYSLLRKYARQYTEGVYLGFANLLESRLREQNLPLNGARVLDVGCFTGEFIELLSQRGADVYGVELQEEAVKIASEKLPGRICQANIHDTDFPWKDFDAVTLLGVIEHVLEPLKLIARCTKLLRPRGVLFIQTPNSGSLLASLSGRYWPPYAPVEHIHLFSSDGVRRLLVEQGFSNIVIKPHWKKLPISYVYNMFKNYGPQFYRFGGPFYRLLPQRIRETVLPFYGGEMLVLAIKEG